MKYPEFGTVSHGTLRNEDLLLAFANELEYIAPKMGADMEQYRDLLKAAQTVDSETEEGGEVVQQLMDALDEFAAPYSYFGAHPGDGSDFGYWPSIDALEDAVQFNEVTKINDLSEAKEAGEYMVVNDHGNVTHGYVADNGEWHTVWDCV